MPDESYSFEIKADNSTAAAAIAKTEGGLDSITIKATGTSKAIQDLQGRFLAAGDAGQRAGKQAGDAMEAAGKKAHEASISMGDLVEAAAIAEGIHKFAELADGFTEISNRLRVVSKDQNNFNGLMDETHQIAQDTRQSWEAVVNTYQRLSNVTGGLGLSQRQVLDLTKEMSMAAKVSGASSQEAAMAMGEITHAFATGALQGREYRVLMRDVPSMMHELQVASGKTGSEFAEMGKHGKISAELLVDWFGKADSAIKEKFGQTLPTISDMLTLLHNAATKFFGGFAQGSGIMKALGDATKFVVDHFDFFAKTIIGVGEALIGLYVIDKVISLVKMLTAAIAANPLGAILVAVTVAISLLRQFGDQINVDSGHVTKMSDVLAVLWEYIVQLKDAIVTFIKDGWDKLTGAFSDGLDSTGIEFSLRNVLLFVASFIDTAIGLFRFLGDTIVTIFGGIPVIIAEGLSKMINDFIHVYNKLRGATFDVLNNTAQKRIDAGDAASQGYKALQASGGFERIADNSRTGAGGMVDKDLYAKNLENARQQIIATEMANRGLDAQGNDPRSGKIGDVNLVPEGSVEAFKQKFKDDWQKDVTDGNFTKDLVTSFMDAADKHAADRVAHQKPESKGTIGTDTHAPEGHGPTDKEIAAMKKLENELRGIVEASNPVTSAQEKLAHAQDIVTEAMKSGSPQIKAMLEKYGGGVEIMDRYKDKMLDQLHPFEAVLRKMDEHAKSLRADSQEQERLLKVEQERDQLKQKGVILDAEQLDILDRKIAAEQAYERLISAEQAQFNAINGPLRTYKLDQEALGDLMAKHKISAMQYAVALDQVKHAYEQTTTKSLTAEYGMEEGWRAIKAEVVDLASTMKTTLMNAFHGINDAIIELVSTGQTDWSKMVDSMLKDLAKLALQFLEMRLLQAAIGGTVVGSAAGGGGLIGALAGHATGGSWRVGGVGGTDSQLVAFRASPTERVTVSDGSSGATTGAPAQGSARGGAIHIHNHNDKRDLLAAFDSPEGDRHIINVMRRNKLLRS